MTIIKINDLNNVHIIINKIIKIDEKMNKI